MMEGTLVVRRMLALTVLVILATSARSAPAYAAPAGGEAPVRLVIPALAVDADVAGVSLNEDLTMPAPPSAALVAWYTYSATAGTDGNVVLAGHRDWQGQRGIFHALDRVAEGDLLWLQDATGVWYLYAVVWSASYPEESAPIEALVGATSRPSMTLITCSGAFDRSIGRYLERRVVRAELVTQS